MPTVVPLSAKFSRPSSKRSSNLRWSKVISWVLNTVVCSDLSSEAGFNFNFELKDIVAWSVSSVQEGILIILNPGLGCSGVTRGNRRPQLAYNLHHVTRHLCLQILSPTSRNASTDPLDEVLKFRREGHLPAAKAQGSNSLGKKVWLSRRYSFDRRVEWCNSPIFGAKSRGSIP